MDRKHFIPYNRVPISKVRSIAEYINKFGMKKLKDFVLYDFRKYHGSVVAKRFPSCSIEIKPLLKVSDALVVITFKSHPFIDPDFSAVGGVARLPKQDIEGALPIPVIYVMPDCGKDIFMHESIHACQYLHDISFPLTAKQKELFLSSDLITGANYFLETAGEEEMINFAINAVCYKTWIEIEASYHTRGRLSVWEWMYYSYRSSCPITSFEGFSRYITRKEKYMKKARRCFTDFCNLMEREVTWIKDSVKSFKYTSLHDLIMDIHEEYECDQLLGDIDEMSDNLKRTDLNFEDFD